MTSSAVTSSSSTEWVVVAVTEEEYSQCASKLKTEVKRIVLPPMIVEIARSVPFTSKWTMMLPLWLQSPPQASMLNESVMVPSAAGVAVPEQDPNSILAEEYLFASR